VGSIPARAHTLPVTGTKVVNKKEGLSDETIKPWSLVPECLCQGKQKIPHRWTVVFSGLHTCGKNPTGLRCHMMICLKNDEMASDSSGLLSVSVVKCQVVLRPTVHVW
jgi:hypothetical protein